MKFSIAMCTFNGAAYLPEQLTSLAAQTRLPDELVISDDNSDDGLTLDILKGFARNAPFDVRLQINQTNLGSKMNFAKTISRCRGEIILLCDQDDLWEAGKLAKIEETFRQRPDAGLVFSDAQVVDEHLQLLGHLTDSFDPERLADLEEGRAFHALLRQYLITGATLAFHSRLCRVILPIPDNTIFQHDAWIGLICAALAPVVLLKDPLIKYRQHPGQQIGVSIKDSKYEQRSSHLNDLVTPQPYPAGELHAFKTLFARLITRSSAGITNATTREIQDWILRLDGEQAVRENQSAPASVQRPWEEMKEFLDSRTIRLAPYIWEDLRRLRFRLSPGAVRAVIMALRRDKKEGLVRKPD